MLNAVTDLDLRLVRVFLAVVDAGGVSAAQALLNVGQPAISSQLAVLETRLGFRLCERGRAGFRLTPRGERLLPLARELLGACEAFADRARHLDRQLVGALNIGLIGHNSVLNNVRISQAIARFRERSEAVRITVSVRPPGELEEVLLAGRLDLAFGYFWHRVAGLSYEPVFTEEQMAYVGVGHTLFKRGKRVSMDELQANDWAWRSYPLPEAAHTFYPQRITAVADNMEAVAMLVLSGRHLGFLPTHYAQPLVAKGLLTAVPVPKLRYTVTFHRVTAKRAEKNEVIQAFLEDLKLG